MKNKLYPILHWQTTLILTPLIYVAWISYLEGVFDMKIMPLFMVFWIYGFLYSLPIFVIYWVLFYYLMKTKFSDLIIKMLLNSFLIICLLVLPLFFKVYDLLFSIMVTLLYSIVIILSSTFYKIRIPKKEEEKEIILEENI